MKKYLLMSAAFVFLGGACITVDISDNTINVPNEDDVVNIQHEPQSDFVSWENDDFLSCIALQVSDEAADGLGYPNGPTDHLCVSAETEETLREVVVGNFGQVSVVMDNLVSPEDLDELGNVYTVDIVDVSF